MNEKAPSAFELAWAQHGRPEAGQKPGLSRGRIVTAAIAVADAEGLGAVSMNRVAKELGFTTMSLYRHVASKEELVLLMQDAAGGPPAAGPVEGSWRDELQRWAWAVLGGFRAHPWIVQTIGMFGAPSTPNQLAWFERGLRALGDTPLTEAEKVSTLLLVDAHIFGDLLFAAASTPSAADVVGGDPYDDGQLVGRLDPESFPALLRAFAGGAFVPGRDPIADRDVDFTFGLDRILDGLERLIEERTGS